MIPGHHAPEDPSWGSLGVDGALGVKGVEHDSEGDVVHHVFGLGPGAALHDHVADVAAAADDAGIEGRVLPRLPAQHQIALDYRPLLAQ